MNCNIRKYSKLLQNRNKNEVKVCIKYNNYYIKEVKNDSDEYKN